MPLFSFLKSTKPIFLDGVLLDGGFVGRVLFGYVLGTWVVVVLDVAGPRLAS